ncbi:hypothetical protein GAPWKB11_0011 [Gilliamella apicola]|nr:DUF5339 domain-containing protein [Gilliamella apicola]KFA59268.1 hypothetical protein GAPWKB11_0011 [Gilliamella apicola]
MPKDNQEFGCKQGLNALKQLEAMSPRLKNNMLLQHLNQY